MVADARWSAVALLGAQSCAIPPDFHTATINLQSGYPTGQIIAASQISDAPIYFEGTLEWVGGRQSFGIQPIGFVGPTISDNYYTGGVAWVSGYGELWVNGSVAIGAGTFNTAAGAVVGWAINPTTQLLWVRSIVGGVAGEWNGSGSADPVAGTGGISISSLTGPFFPFYSCNGSGANSVTINSGGSAYAAAAPAGFGNLPPTLSPMISSIVGAPGAPVEIAWSADSQAADGLTYILDGAPPVACTGNVIGASGVALGPTFGADGLHALAIAAQGNTLDQTPAFVFAVMSKPNGAGALISSGAVQAFSDDETGAGISTEFAATPGFIYKFYMDANSTGHGVSGSPNFSVSGTDSEGTDYSYETAATAFDGTGDDGMAGFIGVSPDTGPDYVDIGTSTSIFGTVTATNTGSNTTIAAQISNNGTAETYSILDPSLANDFTFNGCRVSIGVIYPFVNPTFDWYYAIWAIAAPETLTITSASYSNGTLSIGGACDNAELTALSISSNDGEDFDAASSLDVTGAIYSATLVGVLSAGAFQLQAQDASTGVLSNEYALNIEPPGAPLMAFMCA